MTIYSRSAMCQNGHSIILSFEWDVNRTTQGPREYSEPCPVPDCVGRVAGKLPIGADATSLKLSGT